jgi:asparagine synthase (glutamine-hydrolysing)
MLKADIALPDLSQPPLWRNGAIELGDSRITPHSHACLETVLVRTQGQWFAIVRERSTTLAPYTNAAVRDVDSEEFHRLYQQCLLWPLDYVMVEAAQAGWRMKVRAGVFGSVPVYCRATEDKVMLSWDVTDLATQPLAIDAEIASHRIAMNTFYSARQLCVGIQLLTERASLDVEPGRASYHYPAPFEVTAPAPLPAGREALTIFDELLQRAVSARPAMPDRFSLELSGGMDSASVACALAKSHEGVASKGILLDGHVRHPQVQRRAHIVNRLGLRDYTVEMTAFPPALDIQFTGQTKSLSREYYLEACSALWQEAHTQGHDMLFTGIGGDELFPSYLDEVQRQESSESGREHEIRRCSEQLLTPRGRSAARSLRSFDAPASPVPSTTLLAVACRAPDLLRHGLWPVNPLSDPSLVAFCHRLPHEYRQGRDLIRQYLQKHLGNEVFARNYTKETFSGVMPELVSRHASSLAAQLRDCALADLGLVDQRGALALLESIAATRASVATTVFVSFLWLERSVRQMH